MGPLAEPILDVRKLRQHFPALASDFAFFENAGGSQAPQTVIDAVRDYMTNTFVQHGAPYPISEHATQTFADAHAFANRFVGGESVGRVAFGASSSALLRMLGDAYGEILTPGDEIVVMQANHESCVGPWMRLERLGIRVKFWEIDPESQSYDPATLDPLLGPRTKLVAVSQVSNLLGEVYPVQEIARRAHAAGARIVVDGVAFAPHHLVDVDAWGVDWYVFSAYKVYGPHMGVLFGRHEAWEELTGPNHFFIPKDSFPGKFELGSSPHELAAGLLGVGRYFRQVLGESPEDGITREEIAATWSALSSLEAPLVERLIEFLVYKSGVMIVGPKAAGPIRVGTISFLHDRLSPPAMCQAALEAGVGIRYGHMYAYRLCKALGIDTETGVTRVSVVHYNTLEEVERLIAALDPIL